MTSLHSAAWAVYPNRQNQKHPDQLVTNSLTNEGRGDPNRRGKNFEQRVSAILEVLAMLHPYRASFVCQPTLRLIDGHKLRPDFELRIKLPHSREAQLLECQSRDRTSQQIVDKLIRIQTFRDGSKTSSRVSGILNDWTTSFPVPVSQSWSATTKLLNRRW